MSRVSPYLIDIYIMFYTELLDDEDVRNNRKYVQSFFNVMFGDGDVLSRAINYYVPPFEHCKIALKSEKGEYGYDVYSLTGDHGFHVTEGSAYLHKPGYSVLRLDITRSQLVALKGLLSYFLGRGHELKLSYWKIANVGGVFRYYLNLGPISYPTIKTKKWTCSEIVCFCLQQAGILDKNEGHPTYTTPVLLFDLIINNTAWNQEGSENIYFDGTLDRHVDCTRADTDAYRVYCKIMGVDDTSQYVIQRGYRMTYSMGRRFRVRDDGITQYSIMRSLREPGFKIEEYLNTDDDIKVRVNDEVEENDVFLVKRKPKEKVRVAAVTTTTRYEANDIYSLKGYYRNTGLNEPAPAMFAS